MSDAHLDRARPQSSDGTNGTSRRTTRQIGDRVDDDEVINASLMFEDTDRAIAAMR
ncbi:hypothetical protein [Microbacterium azadirachtae]|uniref:hypothetical protein n=1 Tax=Microbacterium azadirachtae TaxID=582680 RepID=UPI000AFFC5A1|nr:hypothetical protein [Microbacterium azadirachtae]